SSTRSSLCLSFFFQAEDGIRDRNVTGVQTCALPIFIYFLFGINRVRTRARLFAGRHLPVMHFISYEHAAREPSTTDVLAGEVAPPYLAPIGARASGRTLSANNHVSALINGEQFFPRLIEAIDGAED